MLWYEGGERKSVHTSIISIL